MRKALCFSLITIMLVCMACGETQPEISGVSTEYEATKEKMEEKEEPTEKPITTAISAIPTIQTTIDRTS